MKIIVKNLTGTNCLTQEDGLAIYNEIHDFLQKREKIELDFEGVQSFASPFFNFAIGQLLKDIDTETLNECLSFPNINDVGQKTLIRVIANSKKYYANLKLRQAQDSIIDKKSTE